VRAQPRHRQHGGGEVLMRDRGRRLFPGGIDGFRQLPFLGLPVGLRVRLADIFARVLFLLDPDDICGALVAGEQVLAVLAIEKFSQRLDAADDQHQIVLAFEREHGVNEIVPRALLAELDFEAIGEECEQIMRHKAAVN